MNVIALTVGSYPVGEATTNRNVSLLKGLDHIGHKVQLFVLSPTGKKLKGFRQKKGMINGFSYEYTSASVELPGGMIKKIIILLSSVIRALGRINRINKAAKVDAILLQLSEPFLMHPFILYSKIKGIHIYHQQDESPEIVFKDTPLPNLMLKYYLYLVKRLSGVYVISSYLKKYFSDFIDKERICIINMTVDDTRFMADFPAPFSFSYIAYCGTMYGDKDGVKDLITAFQKIRDRVNHKLVLIGDIQDPRAHYVIDLIQSKNLNESIILTGSVDSSDIPAYLKNAEVLLLARPDNVQAKGGFPTKLGEYLLSGKPTIVTAVGDIPEFLTDNVNSFLVAPGDNDIFADKIVQVCSNYAFALAVAERGKKLALEYFNYRTESGKLSSFIDRVNNLSV